jgi:hypothetical protein
MTPDTFLSEWRTAYPGCLPIGYQLRERFPERWFRIHSLPESKRYAETPEEHREVLHRHNRLLGELLGPGGPYLLVTTGYSETPSPVGGHEARIASVAGSAVPFLTVDMSEPDEEDPPTFRHFFMSEHVWRDGSMDALLELVASDTVANVLFVSPRQQRVYHPYDGGGDVLLPSPTERDTMRARYTEWLPGNPAGL